MNKIQCCSNTILKEKEIENHIKNFGIKNNLILTNSGYISFYEKMIEKYHVSARVSTFGSFLNCLSDDIGGSELSIVDPLSASYIMKCVLRENNSKLKVLKNIASSKNTIHSILDCIKKLESSGITPEKFAHYVKTCRVSGDAFYKFKDLSIIYPKYIERLSQLHMCTSVQKTREYIENLKKNKISVYNNIIIDNLVLDQSQTELCSLLKNISENVLFYYKQNTPRNNSRYFHLEKQTISKLKSAFLKEKQRITTEKCLSDPSEKAKFDINFHNIKDTRSRFKAPLFECYEGQTIGDEVNEIALMILNDFNNGILPSDICVSVSSSEYFNVISEIFSSHGINVKIKDYEDLSCTAVPHICNTIYSLITDENQLSNYVDFAYSPIMTFDFSEKSDLLSFQERFGNDKEVAFTNGRKYDAELTENAASVINKISEMIDPIKQIAITERTFAEFTSAYCNFLNQILLSGNIKTNSEMLITSNEILACQNFLSDWNSFIRTIDAVLEIADNNQISFSQYMEDFNLLANCSMKSFKNYSDCVSVVPVANTDRGYPCLYIMGMDEKIASVSFGNVFLDEDDFNILQSEINVDFTRTKDKKTQLINALQELIVSSEKTVISYSDYSLSFQPMKPWYLINSWIPKVCLSHTSLKGTDLTENNFLKLLTELKNALKNDNITQELKEKILAFSSCGTYSERFKTACSLMNVDLKKFNVRNPEKCFEDLNSISVTSLESYNKCHFSFWIDKVFHPRERKIYEETAANRGEFYHEVFQKLFNRLRNNNTNYSTLTYLDFYNLINSIMDQVVENHNEGVLNSNSKNRFETQKMKQTAIISAWVCIQQIAFGKFKPSMMEHKLGENETLLLKCNNKDISVTGKIDRIDLFDNNEATGTETYARVIDYKSGSTRFSMEKSAAGIQLQLPLYMLALNRYKYAGFYYFPILNPCFEKDYAPNSNDTEIMQKFTLTGCTVDNKEVLSATDQDYFLSENRNRVIKIGMSKKGISATSQVLTDTQMNEFISMAENIAKESIQSIINGENAANPLRFDDNNTSCDYCKYKAMCGFTSHDYMRSLKAVAEQKLSVSEEN